MGLAESLPSFTNVVKAEYLVSEILGEVNEDDYFGRSARVLDGFQVSDPTGGEQFDQHSIMPLDESFRMVEPGYMDLEHGYVRTENGGWYVACLTDLGENVNGEMIDWWFRNCDDDEKYRWWHPKDHIKGTWDDSFFAAMPHERNRGHYVGHTHIVEECIGGLKQNLLIEFERTSKYFDVSSFDDNNITACLVAKVYVEDPVAGVLAVGHLIHMVREQYGRSELRSRFWIGNDVQVKNPTVYPFFSGVVNYVSNQWWYKYFRLPKSTARGLWIHCAQEMQCLKEFLPHYYNHSVQKTDDLRKKLWSSADDHNPYNALLSSTLDDTSF